ncbi:MAG: cation:proton antiporter [Pseudomonadota bacterium]
MIEITAAALCAATLWILTRSGVAERAGRAPALLLVAGASLSFAYRASGAPFLNADWVAAGADALLAAIAFAAAAQFRVSRLAVHCPASFRLTLGGAPLFLIVCSLLAFMLAPPLAISSAFLLGGALMLNGAAFDRRAVIGAPAPALIKAAVRLESAAIVALGLPVVVLLEGAATAAPTGAPAVAPLYFASLSAVKGFALGGVLGLVASSIGAKFFARKGAGAVAAIAAAAAYLASPMLGASGLIAAVAAGLVWGEATPSLVTTRVKLRRAVETAVSPAAYFAFGALFAPRFFQGDLLLVVFAIAAITIIRVVPRLIALKSTSLPSEAQGFLAWFGGAPGAASALYLISLFDATALVAQDTILTAGALSVAGGVFAARATSRPLLRLLLKEMARSKKRAMLSA